MEKHNAYVLDCNKSRYDTYKYLFYNYKLTYGHFPSDVKKYLEENKCDILLMDYPRRDEEFVTLIEWIKSNPNKKPKKIVVVYDDVPQRDYIRNNLPDASLLTYNQICKIIN